MKFILYNEVYKAVTYRVALRETEVPLETGKDRTRGHGLGLGSARGDFPLKGPPSCPGPAQASRARLSPPAQEPPAHPLSALAFGKAARLSPPPTPPACSLRPAGSAPSFPSRAFLFRGSQPTVTPSHTRVWPAWPSELGLAYHAPAHV